MIIMSPLMCVPPERYGDLPPAIDPPQLNLTARPEAKGTIPPLAQKHVVCVGEPVDGKGSAASRDALLPGGDRPGSLEA